MPMSLGLYGLVCKLNEVANMEAQVIVGTRRTCARASRLSVLRLHNGHFKALSVQV